jgi:hypothetical protein
VVWLYYAATEVRGTFFTSAPYMEAENVMRPYLNNLTPKGRMLVLLPIVVIAYPVIMILAPAMVRALVPAVVRSVLMLM